MPDRMTTVYLQTLVFDSLPCPKTCRPRERCSDSELYHASPIELEYDGECPCSYAVFPCGTSESFCALILALMKLTTEVTALITCSNTICQHKRLPDAMRNDMASIIHYCVF